ncbi:hypothetical protein RRH01S_01_04960 [Rhizobium rhizogenes NBRC 13257]|uniref:Uncharacterized protein n=1 Tax=Rhizobium rhizogenes NBRC 13257 TaxID=1220581 RepID=A0AA87Q1S3_RHIRH|nr:hypothetical protein RRH01S_01_04960 [Rhizobium rhizogenes NBRC 13257]
MRKRNADSQLNVDIMPMGIRLQTLSTWHANRESGLRKDTEEIQSQPKGWVAVGKLSGNSRAKARLFLYEHGTFAKE